MYPDVVAEGGEEKDTIERLKEVGCDQVKGYYVRQPKPWSEIEQSLQDVD